MPSPAHFKVTPGQRYAIKATILTLEAVPGLSITSDFIRL